MRIVHLTNRAWAEAEESRPVKKQGAEVEDVRVAERYTVEAPVTITTDLGDREKTIEGRTINISSAGAYIAAPRDGFRPGLRVRLEIMLSIGALREVFGRSDRLCVRVGGRVVRIARGGLAVSFDKSYALTPAST
jgi:hypothetical protein